MDIFNEVKKLDFSMDEFAVFGSGPLCIRGLKISNDIDLIVKKYLWEQLKEKYGTVAGKDFCIEIGNIEIFNSWAPGTWDIDKLIDDAEIIEGVRFVKLKTVKEWKKLRGQSKDIKDIELIDRYLKKPIEK